jgi:hypothetical protein
MKKVELADFEHGVITELFDEEIKNVLSNIADENTVPNAERAITIKIAIKPDKLRRAAEVKVHVSSNLAKIKPAESFMFFDRDETGEFMAFEDEPGKDLPGINELIPYPRAVSEE